MIIYYLSLPLISAGMKTRAGIIFTADLTFSYCTSNPSSPNQSDFNDKSKAAQKLHP